MKDKIITLTKQLISEPSISPDDKNCQKIIIELLKHHGFCIEEININETKNLWATHGESSPCFVFAGHSDVVPIGNLDEWICDPFTPTIIDNKLYGRGAADMKGDLAAMIIAAIEFVKENPNHKGKVALLITSDEEAAAKDGTVKVVEWLKNRGETLDYCIVGEPSSSDKLGDIIKNGRRGSITANLRILGVGGHIAYPHLADNAVHKSLKFLDELTNFTFDEGNEYFPPTSLQIANINAGLGVNNVIPAYLDVQFNLRFSSEMTASRIKEIVEQMLNEHRLKYQIEWSHSGDPFLTPKGNLTTALAESIKKHTTCEARLETTGGTSDGRFIAKICPQVVEFGVKNATIHKVNECVDIDDLAKCGQIYLDTLKKLLG